MPNERPLTQLEVFEALVELDRIAPWSLDGNFAAGLRSEADVAYFREHSRAERWRPPSEKATSEGPDDA